jgi:hypothetical protein
MEISRTDARTLAGLIEQNVELIGRLEQELANEATLAEADEPTVIACAYRLHNIYSALENCFDQISRTFENHVVNASQWHRELLWKMFLDLSPLRPAVLPERTRALMDEMLSFRHRFRNNYGMRLSAQKVDTLRQEWQFVSKLHAARMSD